MPNGLPLSRFKAALFDIDGTLVDSLGMLVRGLGDAIEHYSGSRPSDDEIRNIMGLPLREQLTRYASGATKDELDRMVEFTLESFESHVQMERTYGPALEALRLCRTAGMKTALVTSKSTPELEPFLKRFPGAQHVVTTVCASDVVNPKPDPECVLTACQKLGVEPSEAVFIGDSPYDIRAAKSAHVASVAVTYGSGTEEALLVERPDLILRSPEDLLDWVSESLLQTPCHEKS